MGIEEVNTKKCTNAASSTSPDLEKNKNLFNKSFKKVLVDLELFSMINLGFIYGFLFFIPDQSIGMTGAIWVGIIAWRGGVVAGILACFVILISTAIGINIPPHNSIQTQYYFDDKIPGFFIGFVQCLLCGSVVGYISTLVNRLQKEISLREQVQRDLEQKIAELDAFGHGLGLSIVKSIIDRFDGLVGVESEIGKGSLFYFTLPVNMPEGH